MIDAHFHVWDVAFARRPFPYTPDPFPHEAMLELMDEHGIERGIDVTPVMYGFDNAYGLEVARRFPDRFSVFGRFDPLAPDPTARLQSWTARQGAAGVRLTFYGPELRRLEEPEALDPFWSAAEELGVRVAVFAPDALWEIVRVMERHPALRLVVDHLGLGVYPGCENPLENYRAVFELADLEQVLVKVSGVVEVSREPWPFRDVHHLLAEARECFGAGRLMWGSNFPVVLETCGYGESLALFGECGVFTADELALVLGGTCERMLAERLVSP